MLAWQELQKRGIQSTDSALSIDEKIIDHLKGCTFPEAELYKLSGGTFRMSELKGNLVFVHFWFIHCATCMAEIPSINQLSESYKNEAVKFVAISFDPKEQLNNFFKKGKQFNALQLYLDQKTLESTFCILNTYPVNMVLDKNGKVMDAWTEENPDPAGQDGFYNKVKLLIDSNLKK